MTVERPLRMRFQATAEAVAALLIDKTYIKLPGDQRDVLKATVMKLDARVVYNDADSFRTALKNTAKAAGCKKALGAKSLELAREHFGSRDKAADPTTNEKGEVLPDSELRDAEYVPFNEDVDQLTNTLIAKSPHIGGMHGSTATSRTSRMA